MSAEENTPAEMTPQDKAKQAAGRYAAGLINDGDRVGLGTGSTAKHLVEALAERVKGGLNVTCASTSTATTELARELGIKVFSPDEIGHLDITLDGADEFNKEGVLVKGGGGALLQEKIVASMSDRMVVVVDNTKLVDTLGAFPLPIEIVRFAPGTTTQMIREALAEFGVIDPKLVLRQAGDGPFITDNDAYIIDAHIGVLPDPVGLAARLVAIPGVVESGIFLDLAKGLVTGFPDGTATYEDFPLK